ncbi:MAG: radical SAM protein [Clostridia bacterium]|nr:radical SAM protein [Clostridia bacterium]
MNFQEVIIELTDYCNLNCAQCYNKKLEDRREFPSERIEDVCNQITAQGANLFCFGGGEPLLYSHLDNVLNYCRSAPNQNFLFATNGHLLTDELLDELISIGNIGVQVSVDGITREVYEAHRGQNTFDRFYDRLHLLASSKLNWKFARTCVTALNMHEVEDIYRYLVGLGIRPSFVSVTKQGNAVENWDKLGISFHQKISLHRLIHSLNKEYALDVELPIPVCRCSIAESDEVRAISIKTSGDVISCQQFCNTPIGNIFYTSLNDVVSSKIAKQRNLTAIKRKEILLNSTECNSCGLKGSCEFGCIGLAIARGDTFGLDGECEYRKAFFALKKLNII